MKKFLLTRWISIFLCTFIGFTFLSCENNKPDDPLKNGVKNEFGDGRYIIGSWWITKSNNVNVDFRFASNGNALLNDDITGYWSYSTETKLLATTLRDWSWTINIITSHALQGVSVSLQRSYGFKRQTYVDENPRLIIGTWKSDDNTVECIFDGEHYTLTEGSTVKTGKYTVTIKKGNNISSNTATLNLDNITYELKNLQGGYISFSKNQVDYKLYYVE